MYMRAFAKAWPDAAIVQQAVGQLLGALAYADSDSLLR